MSSEIVCDPLLGTRCSGESAHCGSKSYPTGVKSYADVMETVGCTMAQPIIFPTALPGILQPTPVPPQEGEPNAQYVSQLTNRICNESMQADSFFNCMLAKGEIYDYQVTMRNTGSTPWSYQKQYLLHSHQVGTQGMENRTWGIHRAYITGRVIPNGATYTFSFQVKAPTEVGTYYFKWRMGRIRNGVLEPFGEVTPKVTIKVYDPNNRGGHGGGGGGCVGPGCLIMPTDDGPRVP